MPGVTLTERREAGPLFSIFACRVILSVFSRDSLYGPVRPVSGFCGREGGPGEGRGLFPLEKVPSLPP